MEQYIVGILFPIFATKVVNRFHVNSYTGPGLDNLGAFRTLELKTFQVFCFNVVFYICDVGRGFTTLNTLPELSLVFIDNFSHIFCQHGVNIWNILDITLLPIHDL